MAADDWFRNTNWDSSAQALFWEKIKRARGEVSKAQYCRIKALGLIGTGDKKRVLAGIQLLNYLLENWPVRTELAMVYLQMAEAYSALGNLKDAQIFYEKCISQEKAFPHSKTSVNTDFPEFIVMNQLKENFDLALDLVDGLLKTEGIIFAFQLFICHAVRAIIFQERGQKKEASQEAQKALEFIKVKDSGLRYHPDVGLVDTERYKAIIKKISKLA